MAAIARRRPVRRSPLIRPVGLQIRREQRGYSVERMADLLEVADGKYYRALEVGDAQLTLEKALKIAYALEQLLLELPGLCMFLVLPIRGPNTAERLLGLDYRATLAELRDLINRLELELRFRPMLPGA